MMRPSMTPPAATPAPATAAPPPGAALSPAMRQYAHFKKQHPDYLLLFRMGDFYELFYEDAKTASRILGITLTQRTEGVPMAGVPFHSVDAYLKKLIVAGLRVAICEQVEDAKQAKGVVKRDVTRLVTPGTLTDDALLDGPRGNFLAAIAFGNARRSAGGVARVGLAWAELSTGQVVAMTGEESAILDEIARLGPAEVLIPETPGGEEHPAAYLVRQRGIKSTVSRAGWQFTERHGLEALSGQWGVATAAGFGFQDDEPAVAAVGAVLSYLQETQRDQVRHLRPPARFEPGRHLQIDPASYRSLEIDRTTRTGSHEGSVLSAIDRTITAMGGRLLREWLRAPLTDVKQIAARQEAVAELRRDPPGLKRLAEKLKEACDVERIVGRLAVNRAAPRDLAALSACLASMPALLDVLKQYPAAAGELPDLAEFCGEQAGFLRSAIKPDPAPHLREGDVIARGFSRELDELRSIGRDSQAWLAGYQEQLARQTGIASLKIGYNRVFGYYVEISNVHRDKPLPQEWTRRQTTKNAERLITPELKAFEEKALGAQHKAVQLEQELFEQVRNALLPHISQFQSLAGSLARLDVLAGFAALSLERDYCRPAVTGERVLEIVDGRHPVLEQSLGSEFVANGVGFGATDTLQLITGPNMAGKSTFIRQVALIVLLAQCGSDVPAKSARIGVCDKLFTRIGASDEIHAGQSTFMVEMTETANLLNNATEKSLVILDEIGRGTSTLDGLSLAWAIAEHIARRVGCRCLFATHYHELTTLGDGEGAVPGVKNLNVAVREWEEQIIFLHRIVDGPASQSYGIQVAKLAGVPRGVVERASELLAHLRVHHGEPTAGGGAGDGEPGARQAAKMPPPASDWQMSLFTVHETAGAAGDREATR